MARLSEGARERAMARTLDDHLTALERSLTLVLWLVRLTILLTLAVLYLLP
jgi:hypothetical protein